LALVLTVVLSEYDPAWAARFRDYATAVRGALGERAARIDHIGSTSVPGLAAKDVIDLQVSVADLEPFEPLRSALVGLGYEWMTDNDDRRKRFFRLVSRTGARVANMHVRRLGVFSEQAALLFRDYLRATPEARRRYEEAKRALAARNWPTVDDYAEAKGDCIWSLIREADRWAWEVAWAAGPSDA
jgi:GrpB-like predicted nucleotidyltransferase (UPF0157 family)